MTFKLKMVSKRFCPKFSLQVGLFAIANYQHVENETLAINELNLATIYFRAFDPSNVA